MISFRLATAAFALASFVAIANAQEIERPGYRPMRYDEDWTSLRDRANRSQSLDALKAISLGPKSTLTLGGEARLRAEAYEPLDLGFGGGDDDSYLLGRLYLHGDLRVNDTLRGFAELRVGEVWGDGAPLGPVQENDLDLNQAFVDLSAPVGEGRGMLRLGRQEMLFGSGRLVGPRDGPNVRLSFDGARANWAGGGRRFDLFYTRPVLPDGDAFSDQSSETYEFWGAHATLPIAPGRGIDLYYFGLDRARLAFAQGVSAETRHTIGGRWFGRRGPWDWDLEAAYQFGEFGAGDIAAYTLANDIGYTFRDAPWTPRLGLKLDLASGDEDLGDSDLGTFEVPFPKLPYLVEAGFVGPANIMDVHPTLTLTPRPDVSLTAEYVAIWKHETADAFYLPPLRPVTGTVGGDRFLAHVVQFGARWNASEYLRFDAGYVHAFVSNDRLDAAGAEDSDFALLVTTLRF